MLILALDTSSRGGSVAVVRDETIVGVVSTWGDEAYSSRIFRQLEFLLAELRLKLDQFDVFAVAAGPGSFTGLRVGLASAKAWSEAFGRPVVGVSVLEAVAAQSDFPAGRVVAAVDARRGQYYAAAYERVGGELVAAGPDCVCNDEELLGMVGARGDVGTVALVTPEFEAVSALVAGAAASAASVSAGRVHVVRASNVLAPWIGQIAFRRARDGKASDALLLDANYVRRSDAEVEAKGG